MKVTYDRLAVGDRIRDKRQILGITQEELSESLDRQILICYNDGGISHIK